MGFFMTRQGLVVALAWNMLAVETLLNNYCSQIHWQLCHDTRSLDKPQWTDRESLQNFNWGKNSSCVVQKHHNNIPSLQAKVRQKAM